MKHSIKKLSDTLIDVLMLFYIYPDGATIEDIAAPLDISLYQSIKYINALVRRGLITSEIEGDEAVWYPVYTIAELCEMMGA